MSAWGPTLARWVAALLLAGTAVAEIWGLPGELRGASTAMQWGVIVGEIVMIVAGLAGGVGVLRRRAWAIPAAVTWGAGVVLAGGLAPRAFGGTAWAVSAWAALACLAVGALVVWLTRVAVRAPVREADASR